jgi:hypothetical protein
MKCWRRGIGKVAVELGVMRQRGRVLYSHIGTTAEQMRVGCMTNRETITAS